MNLKNNLVKCLFAILAVVCIDSLCHADEPKFRIESYIPEKFVDFQWRVDGNIRMEGDHREETQYNVHEYSSEVTVKTKDVQLIAFTSDVDYINESISRFVICSLITGYSLKHAKPHNVYVKSSGLDPGILVKFDAGTYIHNDYFLSAKGLVQWIYRHNLHDVNPDTHYRKYVLDGALMAGWGRFYEGRFAATALNIIKELDKDGMIVHNADYDELYNLTDKVRYYRLTYRPDERLHKIAALQEIIGLLINRGIIKDPGPYGYLLIQDVWDYFPNEHRYFGWRLRAGFGFNYLHTTEQTTDETTSPEGDYRHTYLYAKEKHHQPYLTIIAQYAKPLSSRWHLELVSEYRRYLNAFYNREHMQIPYYPSDRHYSENLYNTQEQFYSYSISVLLRYFFDLRTSMHLSTSYNIYSLHEIYVNHDTQSYERYGLFNVIATLEYRISIPTTLQINLDVSRHDRRNEYRYFQSEYDVSQYYLSIRFVHYVF